MIQPYKTKMAQGDACAKAESNNLYSSYVKLPVLTLPALL